MATTDCRVFVGGSVQGCSGDVILSDKVKMMVDAQQIYKDGGWFTRSDTMLFFMVELHTRHRLWRMEDIHCERERTLFFMVELHMLHRLWRMEGIHC